MIDNMYLLVLIGIGGAMGFIVDGIDWPDVLPPELPFSQTEVVFIIAVIIYISTTILNILSIKVNFLLDLAFHF